MTNCNVIRTSPVNNNEAVLAKWAADSFGVARAQATEQRPKRGVSTKLLLID